MYYSPLDDPINADNAEADNADYEKDYSIWISYQSAHLQEKNWDKLDIPHLILELEGLNKSNERELESYLIVMLTHLLKWEYQPDKRCGSWKGSINNSRNRINKLFKHQQSLKKRVNEFVADAYVEAKEWASDDTGLKIGLFPQLCPYSVDDLLDKTWFPE